jgi:hypothetical protein
MEKIEKQQPERLKSLDALRGSWGRKRYSFYWDH